MTGNDEPWAAGDVVEPAQPTSVVLAAGGIAEAGPGDLMDVVAVAPDGRVTCEWGRPGGPVRVTLEARHLRLVARRDEASEDGG